VEIKCPYSVMDYSNIEDAILDKKVIQYINLKIIINIICKLGISNKMRIVYPQNNYQNSKYCLNFT